MRVQTYNAAEKYLLENWQQACLVEKSIKAIRLRYAEICDTVLESVKEEHPELDWSENAVKKDGYLAVGREEWTKGDDLHGQICIECMSLEELSDVDSEPPFIGIWVGTPRKPLVDIEGVKRILSAAEQSLTQDEFVRCEKEDPSDYENESDFEYHYPLWFCLPEARTELLKLLFEEDSQRFVDCLVGHFRVFAKMIPVLNDVFPKRGRKV